MIRLACLLLLTLTAALAGTPLPAQEPLSYADLVKHLIDLERLATLPAAGETCRQASSWDRASQYNAASGKYVQWDANGDGGHVIRQEGDVAVLLSLRLYDVPAGDASAHVFHRLGRRKCGRAGASRTLSADPTGN